MQMRAIPTPKRAIDRVRELAQRLRRTDRKDPARITPLVLSDPDKHDLDLKPVRATATGHYATGSETASPNHPAGKMKNGTAWCGCASASAVT
jgi:hypothetical protein